jgi:nucleoside-diphosphate-sugar epimerase
MGVKLSCGWISLGMMRFLAWMYECVPGARWLMGKHNLSRELVEMTMASNWHFSSARAQKELSWKARSLKEGLSDTVEWIDQNEHRFAKGV